MTYYKKYIYIFLKYLFIYFLAVSSLSCGTWDLSLRHTGTSLPCAGFSLVVVRGLSCPVACGILVPRPEIKLASPELQDRFLTTRPPGKSQKYISNDNLANIQNPKHTHTYTYIQWRRAEREIYIIMCAVLAENSWNVELVMAQGDLK